MISLRSARNAATLLSVALAVTGLTASFNYSATAERQILGSLEKLGPELVLVSYDVRTVDSFRVADDLRRIRSAKNLHAHAAPLLLSTFLAHDLLGRPIFVTLVRSTPELFRIIPLRAVPSDAFPCSLSRADAVLLSPGLVPSFAGNASPTGKRIVLETTPAVISGLFTCSDTMLGVDWRRAALMLFSPGGRVLPLDSARLVLSFARGEGRDSLPALERLLQEGRGRRDFSLHGFDALLRQKAKITNAIRLLTESIALLVLVMASIGCMNAFFISVSERRREIALRRALGAGKGEIVCLIMAECYLFIAVGGLAGLVGGCLFTRWLLRPLLLILPEYAGWDFEVTVGPLLKTFIFLLVGATFSGLFPALRAAQTDPATVLRE